MDFLLPASWASAFRRVERDFDMLPVVESVRQHLEIPVLAVSVYLVMVFYVPGRLAKPLTLKWQFTLWNLLLSLFSIVGVSRVAPVLLHNLDTHGLRYTYCEPSLSWYGKGPVGLWVTLFVFSKIPELVDTFFLVFQKKPVIFLHWFHHVTGARPLAASAACRRIPPSPAVLRSAPVLLARVSPGGGPRPVVCHHELLGAQHHVRCCACMHVQQCDHDAIAAARAHVHAGTSTTSS